MPETAFDNLWRGIADQWPSYLAYATSFITIGGIWLAHHGIFRRLQYANTPLMLINLLLLMAVSFLPFPTKLMAEAIHSSDAERAAVIFYGGITARDLVPAQRAVGFCCARPASPSARGEREGVQCDRAGDNPEHRLLHRRDRAGDTGTQDRRVRLSRHRHRGCAASARRQHTTTFNDIAGRGIDLRSSAVLMTWLALALPFPGLSPAREAKRADRGSLRRPDRANRPPRGDAPRPGRTVTAIAAGAAHSTGAPRVAGCSFRSFSACRHSAQTGEKTAQAMEMVTTMRM